MNLKKDNKYLLEKRQHYQDGQENQEYSQEYNQEYWKWIGIAIIIRRITRKSIVGKSWVLGNYAIKKILNLYAKITLRIIIT